MRARVSALAIAACLAFAVAASAHDCRKLVAGGIPPELIVRPAGLATLVCRQAYEALVSDRARDPLWSAERLAVTPRSPRGRRRRRASFHADLRIPVEMRAEPWDYGHGYDRGHMTPAGDAAPGPARRETYFLSNVVPQTPRLNRGEWERIEAAVRRLARRDGPLYVVTGPVLASSDSRTWDGAVEIPAATWKAVYDPARRLTLAWLCANTDEPICRTVTMADIERVTGVDPFPALQDPRTQRRP